MRNRKLRIFVTSLLLAVLLLGSSGVSALAADSAEDSGRKLAAILREIAGIMSGRADSDVISLGSARAAEESTGDFSSLQAESEIELHSFEQETIDLINAERVEHGLKPFSVSFELTALARIKSADMSDNGYFSHTSPSLGSAFDMMKSHGITYYSAAENLARGQTSPGQVVNDWMNSDSHRAAILGDYANIGIGYERNGNYWTMMVTG